MHRLAPLFGKMQSDLTCQIASDELNVLRPSRSHLVGSGSRLQFVTQFAYMVAYFVEAPLETWIPEFFLNAGEEDKRRFAWAIGSNLRDMENKAQREWWDRWLMQYWESRLQGVPAQLDPSEVEEMLNWLPYFHGLFPEAAELAIEMPAAPLEHYAVLQELRRCDLGTKYPEATAKLLIYIAGTDSPRWAWHGVEELIGILRKCEIPEDLKVTLEEISARLGLSTDGE